MMIEVAMGIIALMMLGMMFTELFGVLFSSMKTGDQEVWEYDHVSNKGYDKRRKQLLVHVVVTAACAAAFVALAINRWQTFATPVDYSLANPQEPSDSLVFAAIGLIALALACCARLGILRAKLRAIKNIKKRIS